MLPLLLKTDTMPGVVSCIAADESQGKLRGSALGFLETLLMMRSSGDATLPSVSVSGVTGINGGVLPAAHDTITQAAATATWQRNHGYAGISTCATQTAAHCRSCPSFDGVGLRISC